MANKKEYGMPTPRTLRDAKFKDVNVDVDHFVGYKKDPILIGNPSFWERFKLWLDDSLLRKKRSNL